MRHLNIASSATIAGLLCVCGTALGQNALGDGRGLDAGLHATQGPINPRASGVSDQIRFNNAVINGTAPNGLSFRGSVPYLAPNQFGARAGSDTLYDFKRDSFTSGLANYGVRGSDALRYQMALTTGQSVPGFVVAPVSVARESNVATGMNTTSTSAALRSTAEFVTGQSSRATLVGTKQDEWGAEYVAKASPLLGVTWVKTAESPLGTPGSSPLAPTPQPGSAPLGNPTTTEQPAPPLGMPTPNMPVIPGTVKPGTIQPGLSGMETTANGIRSPLDTSTTMAVDNRVEGASFKASSNAQAQLMTRFREGFTEPVKSAEGPKTAPDVLTFDEQLERLHRRMRGEPDQPETKPKSMTAPDGTLPRPTPSAPDASKPGSKPNSAQPDSRDNPMGTDKTPDAKDNGDGADRTSKSSTLSPEMARALSKVGDKKVEHFAASPDAGHDNIDPAAYQTLMRDGENLIQKGRFFDAEERFTRAIAISTRDPMAKIGRVHAEIGAGLYLSAAANLRGVFADHPEMVGTKYSSNLLPDDQRSKTIIEQLAAEEKKAESTLGRDSALLLAYMGYQRGDANLVKTGLDDLDNRMLPGEAGEADRTLLSVLRAAWQVK